MNKIMKKSVYMYIFVHDRVQRSNIVVLYCCASPLSGQYGKLLTALGERGLVSGAHTITWHVIMADTTSKTGYSVGDVLQTSGTSCTCYTLVFKSK